MTSILPVTEADFQRRVIAAAKWHKWLCVHIRATETGKGRWAVPYEGDRGLPDLILSKAGRVILAELKSDKGRPTKDQVRWLDHAGDHGRLWRPCNWPQIIEELAA